MTREALEAYLRSQAPDVRLEEQPGRFVIESEAVDTPLFFALRERWPVPSMWISGRQIVIVRA